MARSSFLAGPALALKRGSLTPAQQLLLRKDLIYGGEIGAWLPDGGSALTNSGCIDLVRSARVTLIRFALYDSFAGTTNPVGTTGVASRTKFNTAINGIIDKLGCVPMIKLLPIAPNQMGNPLGPATYAGDTDPNTVARTTFCPSYIDDNTLTQNLSIYQDVIAEAGSRVLIYESSNEMEYTCQPLWKVQNGGSVPISAGSDNVSTRLGRHYAANMPTLKKYARSLGFEIIACAYVGVSGGTGWGDTIASPRTKSMNEAMTAIHNAYVAANNDPDYIPDVATVHAYPHSGDFNGPVGGNTTDEIITYFDNWFTANRTILTNIWGPVIGNQIKLGISEWNAGNSNTGGTGWPGYDAGSGDTVDYFYDQWLRMLKRNGAWLGCQFAIASNGSSQHDMIKEDGTARRQYAFFKALSTQASG